jgi:hypothetical protein
MSAEILQKPTLEDLHTGGKLLLPGNLFNTNDNVVIKNYVGVVMKVIGYIRDARIEGERVEVVWFNKDLLLVGASLPEALLMKAPEEDEMAYNDAVGK